MLPLGLHASILFVAVILKVISSQLSEVFFVGSKMVIKENIPQELNHVNLLLFINV